MLLICRPQIFNLDMKKSQSRLATMMTSVSRCTAALAELDIPPELVKSFAAKIMAKNDARFEKLEQVQGAQKDELVKQKLAVTAMEKEAEKAREERRALKMRLDQLYAVQAAAQGASAEEMAAHRVRTDTLREQIVRLNALQQQTEQADASEQPPPCRPPSLHPSPALSHLHPRAAPRAGRCEQLEVPAADGSAAGGDVGA